MQLHPPIQMKGANPSEVALNLCSRCQSINRAMISTDQASLNESHRLMLSIAQAITAQDFVKNPLNPQELALDLVQLNKGQGSMIAQEAEHFRVMLLGLNEKLKALELCQQKNAEFWDQMQESIKAREELHLSIKQSLNDATSQQNLMEQKMQKLIADRNQTKSDLTDQVDLYRNKCADEERLLSQMNIVNAENEKLKEEQRNFDQMDNMIRSMQEQVSEQEQAREELKLAYKSSLENYELSRQQMNKQMQDLSNQNIDIGVKFEDSQNQIHRLEIIKNSLMDEVKVCKSKIESLQSQIVGLQDQADKAKNMQNLAAQYQASIVSLNHKIQESDQNFLVELENMDLEKKNLLSRLDKASQQQFQLLQENKSLTVSVAELNESYKKLQEELIFTEQQLCIQEDGFSLIDIIKEFKENKDDLLGSFYNELQSMSDMLIDQSEKALEHARLSSKLVDAVNTKNAEVELLREMVAELQKSRAYCPVKDDPIDMALSEYLANRAEQMPIPFVREDQGVYLFGTKRVFMKIEQGRIILRVGGGYMHIDQFIEVYTPMECEKMDSRSNGTNLAQAMVAQQLKEKLMVSPQKAARIIKRAISGGSSKFAPLLAVPRNNKPGASPQRQRRSTPSYQLFEEQYFSTLLFDFQPILLSLFYKQVKK